MSEKQYWYGHPRLILNYEKKYKHEMERKQQGYWTIGAYVKNALQSTILMAGLADEKTANKLPKYPDFPKFEEERPMSEKRREAETERLMSYFRALSKVQKANKQRG